MKFTPHQYQVRAFNWIINHNRCLLFLEMGLGKTVTTLSAIQRLHRYGECDKTLVIAPKKVAESTWSDEVERWDHLTLSVSNLTGTEKQRTKALEAKADVYVIGRDSVVWLLDKMGESFDFDCIIIDELTSFKNPSSLRFKALKRVLKRVHRVIGLTGTPTPNGLADLWAQVYCVDQGERLGKYITHFRERWFRVMTLPGTHVPVSITPRAGAQEEIMAAISDISLAMRAEDWLTLPPIIIEDIKVKLEQKIMKGYRDFERDKIIKFKESGEELTASSAATLVNKLAQYANGAIYNDEIPVDEPGYIVTLHDEKIKRLWEIYESQPDSPLLIFYQYKHDRSRIEDFLNKKKREGKIKFHFCAYSGMHDMRLWNSGAVQIMLAHPSSTAYGLNLQNGGHRIVWFSTGWNLELYQQANARLHRQGQSHAVMVYNLISEGTVDEKMASVLRGKEGVQTGVMKGIAKKVAMECIKDCKW